MPTVHAYTDPEKMTTAYVLRFAPSYLPWLIFKL